MGPGILERFSAGDRRALSRAASWAEGDVAEFPALFDAVWPRTGRAVRVGVTGPPGAGKSTLVSEITRARRAAGETVGIVAVDPTSPYTGGALLGDRVRMVEHTVDSGVFIRSMASRGSRGGLARRSIEVADLLDAFGFDHVLVETVGVGQVENDICAATDVVVVVLHPLAGDSVQAMKSGLLELADVFAVNKADHPGADRLVADLDEMQQLRSHRDGDPVPVCRTVASRGRGVAGLVAAIDERAGAVAAARTREERRAARLELQVRRIVEERLRRRVWGEDGVAARAGQGSGRAPYAAADALLATIRAEIES